MVSLVLSLSFDTFSQGSLGRFELEITQATVGIHIGPYRGRTDQTNGFFNEGIAGFAQIYFPFQFSLDYRKNYLDSNIIRNEYHGRLFTVRMASIIHLVDNGSYSFGAGIQMSWLIKNNFYLDYQLSGVYLEASNKNLPDLKSGFNLHHFISISRPVTNHWSLSFGYVHLSNARVAKGKGSNQDIIVVGAKINF